ncbi:hypoxia-inducible lipid droplet-associated protein-like [Nannospalax galili]|uniref:hypoxia-inducible lipid droplet-associated protein-like n=1 Tax=Nannospalax galili TaxID=1026970 RepID=UPI0004ED58BE|nr:hypoxia-inducible lipid droplet-associated protein-like [Nannospalax galili]
MFLIAKICIFDPEQKNSREAEVSQTTETTILSPFLSSLCNTKKRVRIQKRKAALKYMLNLSLLGMVVTLLSIFIRLMESLGGLLEGTLPGSPWTTIGQLANTEPSKGLPDHPSRGVQ